MTTRTAIHLAMKAVGYDFPDSAKLLTRADEYGTSLWSRLHNLTEAQAAALTRAGKFGWRFDHILHKKDPTSPIIVVLRHNRNKMEVHPDRSTQR